MEQDLAYYRRRATEESLAADAASDPRVRQVHLDLARRYAEMMSALEPSGPVSHLRLVSAA